MPVVRRATLTDRDAVLRLWRALQQVQGHLRPFRPSVDADDAFLASFDTTQDDDDTTWLVADDGDPPAVVAMAELHLERPSRLSDERIYELSRVCVDPAARGRGIGRLLVVEAERLARERGVAYLSVKVFTGNAGAVRFWDDLGFATYYEQRMRKV